MNFFLFFSYNGSLPQGERGRRKSKYLLYKRSTPNGIKKSRHYVVKQPQATRVSWHLLKKLSYLIANKAFEVKIIRAIVVVLIGVQITDLFSFSLLSIASRQYKIRHSTQSRTRYQGLKPLLLSISMTTILICSRYATQSCNIASL